MPKKGSRERAIVHIKTVKQPLKGKLSARKLQSMSAVRPPRPEQPRPSWRETVRRWTSAGAEWLTLAVQLLLILVLLMALFCMYRQSRRISRLLDLMTVAWKLLMEVVQRSGVEGHVDSPADLVKYVRMAKNMTWPVCSKQ